MILLKTLRNIVPLLILSLSPSLFGQAVNATLLGTIKDATGATVPGAKVTVTDTATGTTHESVTNESGNYTLPDLPPRNLQHYYRSERVQEGHSPEHRSSSQHLDPR